MGRSHSSHRSEIQKADHKREIARRYLRCETQATIGAALGISRQTVSLDLKEIHEEWKDEYLGDYTAARSKELARIDRLEETYWAAWERSREDLSKRTQHITPATDGGAPRIDRIQVESVESAGDTRYLDGIKWCVEQRAKILGFNAPSRHEIGGGERPIGIDVSKLTDEQLRLVASGSVGPAALLGPAGEGGGGA